ncbi:hypothetical protein F2Q69_00015936 [Brassica cretica]|uniref:Uncharacterized protein n=1 Tax=Brassica cretica TaxID=69181 RepID=A0A8S9QZF2_BRACR|nr:hypothetical protein F2Q69_00015936 [Brassica cretica]
MLRVNPAVWMQDFVLLISNFSAGLGEHELEKLLVQKDKREGLLPDPVTKGKSGCTQGGGFMRSQGIFGTEDWDQQSSCSTDCLILTVYQLEHLLEGPHGEPSYLSLESSPEQMSGIRYRGIDRFPGSDSALLSRKDVVGLICTVAVGFTGSGIHFDLADL